MGLDGGDGNMPGLIGSLFLLIVGAITKYAYSDEVLTWTASDEKHSLQLETVGNILLIAGLIALVLSVAYAFMSRYEYVEEEEAVFEEPEVLPRSRKTVVKDDVVHDGDNLPLKSAKTRRRTKSE
jgi:hypothetical protein